jgi:cold shock CspA family protein
MADVCNGIIKFSSDKGWYFAENLEDHSAIFISQRDIERERYLKVGDRITFEVAPSPKHAGRFCAVNVKYVLSRPLSEGAR